MTLSGILTAKNSQNPSNTEKRPIPVSPAPFSPWRLASNPLVHVACIVFLILIVYSNTLNAPFQWDEDDFIVNNPIVKDLHYFSSPGDARGLPLYSALITRYVGFLTFAINYHMNGLSVTGYHIVNIAIHIASSILVYLLVLLTFSTPYFRDQGPGSSSQAGPWSPVPGPRSQTPKLVAFFSSLIFAAHPLQIEAVTYVFQRLASLAAFFYLLSLVTYIKSRLSEGRKQQFFYYTISLISSVLAIKTKENAFTLPLVITLFEFCFFAGSTKKRILYLVPLLLTLTIIPLTLMSLSGTLQIDPGAYGARVFSRREYLFTQFRVIVTYLRLLFLPVNQNIDHVYPVFESFFDQPVVLSFFFLSALFGLGVYMVSRFTSHDSRPLRLMGFGILWFFITLSVESSIVPIPWLINEYRAYLPSIGIIICVVTGVFLVFSCFTLRILLFAVVTLLLVTGVFSVATYLRNDLWGDKIRLWEDTAEKSPGSALVHNNLGIAYQARNMTDNALGQYLTAIRLRPDYAKAHHNLGTVYSHLNMPEKALEQYLTAVRLQPDYAEAHFNLGALYYRLGQMESARTEVTAGLKIKPDDQLARQLLEAVSR